MNKIFEKLRERNIDILNIQTTSSCNYACGMCPFHGEGYSGQYFKERPSIKREITIQEFEKYLQEAKSIGIKKIDLTPNGEFFTHSNWRELLKAIKRFELQITITTNGGLLYEKDIQELCEIGVDFITVSIDSVNYEHYKKIRKPATLNAFNRAINVPILLKKYGSESMYVQIQITEQPDNPSEVKEILDFYKDYQFNQITVNKMFSTTDTGIEYIGVEKHKQYKHGTCKSYGSPILMPDGTVLPCCGAFYFYPKMGDKIPNINKFTLDESIKKLDDIYETDITFRSYCENCSLYDIGNTPIVTKSIYGKYFVQKDSVKSRYFKVPYHLYFLPDNILLWMYDKKYINKIKNFFNYLGL